MRLQTIWSHCTIAEVFLALWSGPVLSRFDQFNQIESALKGAPRQRRPLLYYIKGKLLMKTKNEICFLIILIYYA